MLVIDVTQPIEDIRKSIVFWDKYIRAFVPKETNAKQYSTILVGNKTDKASKDAKKKAKNLFATREKQGEISATCFSYRKFFLLSPQPVQIYC